MIIGGSIFWLKKGQKLKTVIFTASCFASYSRNNMTKVDYVLQEVRVPGQLHFCIQRSVYLILACNSHHYACASIAWVLLLHKQPLRGFPPRQSRENVRLKNREESPRFISSMCEHVSCKEVCLSSRRMSGLPDWCNTPEEKKAKGHKHRNFPWVKLSRIL